MGCSDQQADTFRLFEEAWKAISGSFMLILIARNVFEVVRIVRRQEYQDSARATAVRAVALHRLFVIAVHFALLVNDWLPLFQYVGLKSIELFVHALGHTYMAILPAIVVVLFEAYAYPPAYSQMIQIIQVPLLVLVFVLAIYFEQTPTTTFSFSGYHSIRTVRLIFVTYSLVLVQTVFSIKRTSRSPGQSSGWLGAPKQMQALCKPCKTSLMDPFVLELLHLYNVHWVVSWILCRGLLLLLEMTGWAKGILRPFGGLLALGSIFLMATPTAPGPPPMNLFNLMTNKHARCALTNFVTCTGEQVEYFFFLLDAAIFRQRINDSTAEQLKYNFVIFWAQWMTKRTLFPTILLHEISEQGIRLLQELLIESDTIENTKKHLSVLFIPLEREASRRINLGLVPAYHSSYLGRMENTYQCYTRLRIVPYTIETLSSVLQWIFKVPPEYHLKTPAEILYANPYTLLGLTRLMKLYNPTVDLLYESELSLTLPIDYVDCFTRELTGNALSQLFLVATNSPALGEQQRKDILHNIRALVLNPLLSRLFAQDQMLLTSNIQKYYSSLIGARSPNTRPSSLIRYIDPSARVEAEKRDSYLANLRSSVSRKDERTVRESVTEFLATTFYPNRDSTDEIQIPGTESSVEQVRGNYLADPTPPLQEQVYRTMSELSDSEKLWLKECCLSRSALFNPKDFVIAISSPMECPINFFNQGTKETLRTHGFYIADSGSISSKAFRETPSNQIKMFRLLYSCFHHFDFLNSIPIPPQAISDLCFRLTINEKSLRRCSTQSLLIVRHMFSFLYVLSYERPGILTNGRILGLLLAAACANYKRSFHLEDDLLSLQHWLSSVYCDRSPGENFTAACGWIAIIESGLLLKALPAFRKEVRGTFIAACRTISTKRLMRVIFDIDRLYQSFYDIFRIEGPDRLSSEDKSFFILQVCKAILGLVANSDDVNGRPNSLHTAVTQFSEEQRECTVITSSLPNGDPYHWNTLGYLDLIPQNKYTTLKCIIIPMSELLQSCLSLAEDIYAQPFEKTRRELSGILKQAVVCSRLWEKVLDTSVGLL
ncbi:hypothetical protein GMRT_10384 [Giardia muris]|uniref:Uncharacterized protein n=1 Tax=Giardia muris TaxID=5742 RepID=A0A4Z1TC61_GIAMU|nr:hypothetical protein GMRT_10384 [Giardia muris]|eukprot:TNJ30061.1 hypothetical protein GMRT_10384 [Giardia muris]